MKRAELQAVSGVGRLQSPLYNHHNRSGAPTVSSLQPSQQEWGAHSPLSTIVTTGVSREAPTVLSLQSSQQEWGPAQSPFSTIVTTGVSREAPTVLSLPSSQQE